MIVSILLMSMSLEKTSLLNEYLQGYTDKNRYNFCTIALRKYKFEKYPMCPGVEIAPEDLIVNDNNVRSLIKSVIDKEECNVEDFHTVFDALTVDQINYIGY
jgi:hypothetical protein